MQTNQLQRKHPNTKRMTVARGGKRGKTAGRGGKGQSARAGNKRRPDFRDIIKKLPKMRGRGVNMNKAFQIKPVVVNVGLLEEMFQTGAAITPTILVENSVISLRSGRMPQVKILGDGELTRKLTVTGCIVSDSAKVKIEKAGGTVTLTENQVAAQKKLSDEDRKATSDFARTDAANTASNVAAKKAAEKPASGKAAKGGAKAPANKATKQANLPRGGASDKSAKNAK